ncbi:hypothetical protein OOK27_12675 [Streptomyces canus]|uniref:hypothetical protein n=1 Tax=Streptomyces canus TaxID=58343 RepID=UPI00225489C6|nr:hypothetical protein [Streptomyces canus]MCX5255013.1 hypothetical protein [Streptomyces canus]
MSERRVITCPPYGTGGRRAGIDDQLLRTACRLHDLTVFRQNAVRTGRHELDVVESGWNVRHEASPEVRGH